MRRQILCIAALLMVVLAAATEAGWAQEAAARREIEGAYRQLTRAMKEKSTKGLEALLAADFVNKSQDGKTMDRKTFLAGFRKGGQEPGKLTDVTFAIGQLSVSGGMASAVTTIRFHFAVPGQSGRTHKLVAGNTSRDTLVKTGGTWKFKRSEDLKSSATLDGKPGP